MTPFWKYTLFVLLGAILGAAPTAAVMAIREGRFQDQLEFTKNARDTAQHDLSEATTQAERFKAAWLDALKKLQKSSAATSDPNAFTIIYDQPPTNVDVGINFGLAFHGIGLAKLPRLQVSQGPLVPRWAIQGSYIVPIVLGEAHGAVYFMGQNGQWTGPFNPPVVRPQ